MPTDLHPPPGAPLVLVVEDEPHIAEILVAYLRRDGFGTALAADGPTAVAMHQRLRPSLIVLDVMLPGFDGFEVLRRVRSGSATPVIMVTARDEDIDKLVGLRMGADDYVVKPFSPPEVVARVQAVLRRATPAGPGTGPDPVIRLGPVQVDTAATIVLVGEVEVDLTAAEYRLLEHFARSPRRTFTRAQLLAAALPDSAALERVVDAHLANLRRKLADAGAGDVIETVRGLGYRLRTGS